LVELASEEDPDDRPSYAETDYPRRAFGWSSLGALRIGKYLYINAPKRELYDLDTDPQASRNLAASSAPIADTLSVRLEDIFKKYSSDYSANEQSLDPENLEKLRALGYVGGGRVPTEEGKALADPKDKIDVANDLHDAMHAVESDQLEKAVTLLRRVLAADPQIYAAQYQLGIALSQLGRPKEAVEPLRKALALLRDSAMAQYELGIALFESGQWKASVPHFEAAVAQMPNHVDAVFSLAAVYARTDRIPEAKDLLQSALKIEPEHYRANLLYGRILDLTGQSADAVPHLETAARVQAKSLEARLFLADAYEKLGRAADAQRARREAAALRQSGAAMPQ
jgi:tetratricopeptide (TPR) repeat protein